MAFEDEASSPAAGGRVLDLVPVWCDVARRMEGTLLLAVGTC